MPLLRPLLAALVLLAATTARPAAATVIHVETTTTVDIGAFGDYGHLFAVGETVRIRYSYDDTVADSNAAAGSGTFDGATVALSAEFLDSGLEFFFEGGSVNSIVTTDNSGSFTDSFAVSATGFLGGDLLDGATPATLSVTFAVTTVPGPPVLVVNERQALTPFSYGSGNLTLGSASGSVAMFLAGGSAAAAVPEPGAAALLGCAGAGVAFARRRRADA